LTRIERAAWLASGGDGRRNWSFSGRARLRAGARGPTYRRPERSLSLNRAGAVGSRAGPRNDSWCIIPGRHEICNGADWTVSRSSATRWRSRVPVASLEPCCPRFPSWRTWGERASGWVAPGPRRVDSAAPRARGGRGGGRGDGTAPVAASAAGGGANPLTHWRQGTTRDRAATRRLFRLAQEVLQAIEAGVFPPHPGWQCKECPYRGRCWVWG